VTDVAHIGIDLIDRLSGGIWLCRQAHGEKGEKNSENQAESFHFKYVNIIEQ
jgi:hypothetical protein